MEPLEPEQLEKADPPAHQVHRHLGCLFSLVPHHGVRSPGWGLEGLQREGDAGEHRPAPFLMEGGHLGKFGERENSELSTFLFLFFFLTIFFFPKC